MISVATSYILKIHKQISVKKVINNGICKRYHVNISSFLDYENKLYIPFIYLLVDFLGAPPISTSRPEPPSTPAPVPQVPVFVVIVVIVVVVCIILALTVILVICCISSFRRRHQRKKRQDQNELNRISRIARALKERDNQVAKHPPEAASSDHEVQQNR